MRFLWKPGSCCSLRVELRGHQDTCEAVLRWWGTLKLQTRLYHSDNCSDVVLSNTGKLVPAYTWDKVWAMHWLVLYCSMVGLVELWEKSVTFHGGRSCQGRRLRLRTLSSLCDLWMLFAQSGILFSFLLFFPSEIIMQWYTTPSSTKWCLKSWHQLNFTVPPLGKGSGLMV